MMLKFFKKLFPIRACLNCGSWIQLRTFFCEPCHAKCVEQFHNKQSTEVMNIKVKSLFRWPPGKSDVLSSLVLQMKNENEDAWLVWAEEFMFNSKLNLELKDSVLVSSQSSSGHMHAQNWGGALSKLLNFPHICPLKLREPRQNQKKRNRHERAIREFETPVEISKMRYKRIIFVDDVVTTGQTALAAYRALKEPPHFEIWCLIYREH